MIATFKKGHIIPRWCNVKTDDRKAQHCVKFGCDVEVHRDGPCALRFVALTPGSLIYTEKQPSRRMKGGSIKRSRAVVLNICGDFSKLPREPQSSFVQVPGLQDWQAAAAFSTPGPWL